MIKVLSMALIGITCISLNKGFLVDSLTSYQVNTKTACMEQIKGSERYVNEVTVSVNPKNDICIAYGIDYNLIKAIGIKETGLDYTAIGDQGRSKGAYQIQDAIWSNLYGDLNLFDEYESTKACCIVVNYLLEQYGTVERMLNAYNTGNPDNYNGYSADVLRIKERLDEEY